MADSFGTTFEEMQAGATHIDNVNDQINGQLSTLRGHLAPLAGVWRGSASAAFVQLMARYDSSANKISEALRAIAEQVRGANATYMAEEETHSSSLNQISSALDG
jgi:WXG100 family type VII secretion target